MDATEVEKLKQQIEMMKALGEEKSHHQQDEAKLVSAGTSNTTNPAPQPLRIPTGRPEIGTPDRFDRTRGAKAKTYGVQVAIYINLTVIRSETKGYLTHIGEGHSVTYQCGKKNRLSR
ncbi:hypothetical protein VP01_195g6 [Puccinia sorghi]|uniref:Uncharacterized protein n=1 Tax=Puccinia sorghi TaxID=27349 RepID=A0A0L6VDU1_9BASI|nr:hypothetical protein VP01_195g6 [Puccinia sorghi]